MVFLSLVTHTNSAFASTDTVRCNTLISESSFDEAYAVCRTAAEQGSASAQLNLGFLYRHGEGVIQDYTEAVRWYRAAAEQGHTDAQFYLGVMYANGLGVIQDYTEAVRWYSAAAEQGDADAQFNLGWLYKNGDGVLQDYLLAHMWLNISAANGNVTASVARNLVSQLMSNEQIAKAQALARQCINSIYTDCGY